MRKSLIFGLVLYSVNVLIGCKPEDPLQKQRKAFIAEHRNQRISIVGAESLEGGLVDFLNQVSRGEPPERFRYLIDSTVFQNLYYANLPDDEILPPALSPEAAWELQENFRKIVLPRLHSLLQGKTTKAVRFRVVEKRTIHSLKEYRLAELVAETDAGPVPLGSLVRRAMEYEGQFLLVSLSPQR